MSRGAAIPLWLKTSSLASYTLVFIAWWQIERALELPAGASFGSWAYAIGLPLCVPAILVAVLTKLIVRWKTGPLEAVFQRIASGDFSVRLPPAPDRDFLWIEQRFDEMQRALHDLTEKLKRADADRRRLFADLAHELATPTSSVLGIAEALQKPSLLEDERARARMLAALDEEATRLERLVRDVRDLATLDDPDTRLEPREVDLAELVERAALRVSALSGRAIACMKSPCRANVDALRVDQVVMNLLTNAVRHTPAPGHIRLEVGAEAGGAVIVVEDEGPGVPDAILPLLGERLFRVDMSRSRTTGGHGLGLSIVRAVVKRHGGTVTFERGNRGGLRVCLRLPAEPRTTP